MFNHQLIEKIITLSNGPLPNQLKAVNHLKNIFHDKKCLSHVDIRTVHKLLPTIIGFLNSTNEKLKSAGAYFCTAITSSGKEATKLAMEVGAISALINFLSTTRNRPLIREEALRSLGNIASDFPKEVAENGVLEPLMKCLKANNAKICYEATVLLNNVSCNSENNSLIIGAGGDETLMQLLDSKHRLTCQQALDALINIITWKMPKFRQRFFQQNLFLKLLKKLSNGFGNGMIKFLAAHFVEEITKNVNENLMQIILQNLSGTIHSDDIKILCAKIIQNIIKRKHNLIPMLIENNVISLIAGNLLNKNDELTILLLSILEEIILVNGYENIEINFQRCGGPLKITKLLEHGNSKIKEIASRIQQFLIGYLKPEIATGSMDLGSSNDVGVENELNALGECQTNQRKRKHSFNSEIEDRKASKTPLEHTDTEQSVSPEGDFERNVSNLENFVYDDTVAANDESNANNGGRTSNFTNDVYGDTVTPDEASARSVSRKSSPAFFLIDYPTTTIPTCSFDPIKYSCPSEHFIKNCCENLGLQFDRKKYLELLFKIEFDTIFSASKLAKSLEMFDQSGFGCFSVIFSGNEDNALMIKKKLNEYFIDNRKEFFAEFDAEKITEIINSPILTSTHLEAICRWFGCRILVYCNETWTKYGQWTLKDSDKEDVPIFVLEKKEFEAEINYSIVLSLMN